MPDFIKNNWKAWAGSLSAMLAAALVGGIHKLLPTFTFSADFDQGIRVVLDGIVVGALGWALTWVFPANTPSKAALVAQGQTDPSAKAEIKAAAATLSQPAKK